MPVVDATFLVDLERGLPAATAVLERLASGPDRLVVPAQAAAEFATGQEDAVAALADLESMFEIVPFGRPELCECARLAREALGRGSSPGWADLQVAATAVLESMPVLTADAPAFRALGCAVWDYRNDAEPPG
ncbi:MAG: type II toxin-antitoxin system VapC family toxin [Methanobacteriota archaeon]